MDSLYEHALNLSQNLPATPSAIDRVAKATSVEAARWAFSQWNLRARAAQKFDLAHQMLFDRDGLEMATHERVATYHAGLFPKNERILDLTTGIGADLIALARRGPAIGFELDAVRAEYARHNLQVNGLQAEVLTVDGMENPKADYYFADPSRRSKGTRTSDPGQFEPDPSLLVRQFSGARLGIIKLSPMLPDSYLQSLGSRVDFVSFGGECREALVHVGKDAEHGRFAIQIETGACLAANDSFISGVEEPDRFLFEADPAAIRANALAELCRIHELRPLADSNGYLTGPSPTESPWLRGFRVLWHGRFDLPSLKRKLAELRSQTPVLKQRGAGQDLQKLQKSLILNGERPLQAAFYRVGKSIRVTVLDVAW